MSIIWIILIGFLAGVIAKLIHPGPNEPSGFILTTLLGIAGAFVATYLGQAIGWYRVDQGAGLIGATVGAVIVLFVWGMFAKSEASSNHESLVVTGSPAFAGDDDERPAIQPKIIARSRAKHQYIGR